MATGCVPLLVAGVLASAQSVQPLRADDLEIFFGVVPSEIVLGHPRDHFERKMHGGVPSGSGQHHLVVSLFDAKTAARITAAKVEAAVTEPGLSVTRKQLEPMTFAGAVTFGNYFNMQASGPLPARADDSSSRQKPAGRHPLRVFPSSQVIAPAPRRRP